jgi:hypothetical protein
MIKLKEGCRLVVARLESPSDIRFIVVQWIESSDTYRLRTVEARHTFVVEGPVLRAQIRKGDLHVEAP